MIGVYPLSTATVDSQLATLKFLVILEKESNWMWIFQSPWVKLIHMAFLSKLFSPLLFYYLRKLTQRMRANHLVYSS